MAVGIMTSLTIYYIHIVRVTYMSQAVKIILENQIKAAFTIFDREGNGTIEFKDFGTLMRSIGYDIDEEIAIEIAEKIAKNSGESFVQYSDFKNFYITALNSTDMREDFKLAFDAIDTDKDKLISFSDLKNFLEAAEQKRTDDQINEMISDADIDGDGMISFEQFIRLMATR